MACHDEANCRTLCTTNTEQAGTVMSALQRLASVSRTLDDVQSRRSASNVRRFSLAFFVLTGGFWYLAFLLRASRRHRHIMEQANMLPQVPEFPIEQALPYTSQEATPVASGALRPVSDWLERTEVSTDTPEERIFELERQQSSARRPDATAASSDTSRWNGPWRKSQLRAFLQRDESLLHHTASSCDQEFVGWELFDRWRRQRRVWCSQYDSEEDQTGTHSELSCGKLAIPQHGDRYVCEGRNLSTSWALVDGVAGGDDVQAVMGQSERLETYRYKPGFLTARCHVVESNLQPDGLQPPARDWFGALSSVSSDTELPCDEWIEDPVVVVSRVEYANFYHTMTDFVGTWSAAVIAGMDPSNVRILFADGHPKSPFDSAWGKIFSGGRPPLRKQDLANRRVCLRHAVFAFYGYASPMTINWFRADPCKSSSWLGAFSHQVLEAYDLERPSPAPCGADCSSANLTLILREDYVAHPRETKGGQRHNKIFNPDELLQVMRKRVGSHAQAVKMAFLSFEEQLSLVRSTNVLIGMHGAALTFLPFLADNAVVIELVPVNGMKKFHFQNLAAWSDKGFLLWRNSIAENEKDAMNTLVDPTQFDGLLSKALRKLDAPR